MRGRMWLVLTLILILVIATACEGGTHGSVMGASQRCSHGGDSGKCTGSWKKLSGTYSLDIESERIPSGGVRVQVQASAETGRVKVWIKSPEDEITSVEVAPGKSATLEGVAKSSFDEFDVMFEALDGEAQGVSYEIVYQIP
jgi:hypothetical protein